MSRRRVAVFLLVLTACAGCDQASKEVAWSLLAQAPELELAGGLVRFERASNPGAFLGLGAELPETVRRVLWMGLVPLLVVALSVSLLTSHGLARSPLVGLGLVVGGGLGNWLDRLLHDGAVRDFVSLGVGPLRTGIFNGADVAILLGVALLLSVPLARDHPRDHPPGDTV
ncbi:MAG: signal peptidase II [Myxococcota bacterium]|nr:signal peptidase II [Myxococcota bacterium]